MKGSILVILLFSLLSSGCSPETRYRVLSFFVDGVPPPEKVSDKGEESEKGEKSDIQRLKVAIHGPYGARMCTACHEGGFSNRLLLPREKLCYRCHSFKMEAKWIHGPIASGGCMLCHDPHNSKYEYLLVGSSQEFCFYCHQRSAVLADESHSDVMERGCTTCHDAHMSDRQFLLKEDVALFERTTKVEEDSQIR
jgi:predicted CXXCH cytochrome family protein